MDIPNAAPGSSDGRRSLGELLVRVLDGARTLVRKEAELARIELKEAMAQRAAGAGAFALAAVFGLFAMGFILAAAAAALAVVLPMWAALLIVGVTLFLVTAIGILVGRQQLRKAPMTPVRTRASLKEDVAWAKSQIAR
jgi:hypothetical protein